MLSAVGFAQPDIQQPAPYVLCDTGNDEFEQFNLTTRNAEIMNGLDPEFFSIAYFETAIGAETNSNAISQPASYSNTSNPQTVFVRVWENADPGSYSITMLSLVLNPSPTGIISEDMTVCLGNDASVTFLGAGGSPPYTFIYNINGGPNQSISSSIDQVTLDLPTFVVGMFNYTLVSIEDSTGCTSLAADSALLTVVPLPGIATPSAMVIAETPFDGAAVFNLSEKIPEITAGQAGSTVTFYLTEIDAQAGTNQILSPFFNTTNPQTIYARAENAVGCYSITSFQLLVINSDIIFIPDANYKAALISLGYDTNSDGEIQYSEGLAITSLTVPSTGISDFTGTESFTNLSSLLCPNNNATSFNIINSALTMLDISQNELTSLNIGGLPNLVTLICNDNELTTLNLGNSAILDVVQCTDNIINNLDASGLTGLSSLVCENNPLLELNVKNGANETVSLSGSGDLAFICADEFQVATLQLAVGSETVVSSYCSFTPGGIYNTVSGTVRFDMDNNGCDDNDNIALQNLRIDITSGSTTNTAFLNGLNYFLYVPGGNYTLTPQIENPSYFNVSPASVEFAFSGNVNETHVQSFCVTANGIHPDVEVVIAPMGPARPGFDAYYAVIFKNIGNQMVSGSVGFTYEDDVLDFVSVDQPPASQTANSLLWNYADLLPFETRVIYITLNVNAPTDTPAVNLGDFLDFAASAPVTNDDTPANNFVNFKQVVVGSYDPNEKTCIEGNVVSVSQIGEYLHYVINFENTGTYPAQNVIVKDVINTAMFDVSTLRVINTSHPVNARTNGNTAEFIFENINLDIGGHGNILLKIKTLPTLSEGSIASNKAEIYFDYNLPVITEFAHTAFQSLTIPENPFTNGISFYPNPVRNEVNIKSISNLKELSLYDLRGRLLLRQPASGLDALMDISQQSEGVYLLKVVSDKGVATVRLIKQ